MTLGICQLLGIDLQQVSIAAMIIALGLLVDDPVVAGDAINREMAHGQPRDVAAWLGPQKLARAILYATVTNCVAFLPLLLVQGQDGRVHLLAAGRGRRLAGEQPHRVDDLHAAVGILRAARAEGIRGGRRRHGLGRARGPRLSPLLPAGAWTTRRVTLARLRLALLRRRGRCCRCSAPPSSPRTCTTSSASTSILAEGSPIRQTRDEALKVIREIEKLEGDKIRAYTTFVGQGGPRFWLSIVPEQRADNYAQILVHTSIRDVTRRRGAAAETRAAAGRGRRPG